MKIVFHGHLVPEVPTITFGPINDAAGRGRSGIQFRIEEVRIVESKVTCAIEVEPNLRDLLTLRNIVDLPIRAWIDLIGFQTGRYYELELTHASFENGESTSFENIIPVLARRAPNPGAISRELLQIVSSDEGASIALACLRKAMKEALATGFYCYQGIEAIMHALSQTAKKGDSGWVRFKAALNVEEAVIRYVQDRADDKRHGRSADITDMERQRVFLILQHIIERYFQFRLAQRKGPAPQACSQLTLSAIDVNLIL